MHALRYQCKYFAEKTMNCGIHVHVSTKRGNPIVGSFARIFETIILDTKVSYSHHTAWGFPGKQLSDK